MPKIVFLIPPSEGKNTYIQKSEEIKESLSFNFKKPDIIAINASERDLKCIGKRYQEGIELNKNLVKNTSINYIKSINRYSGVMYNAIDFLGMHKDGKQYFEDNFLILSAMYGILKINDLIGNYKLPIESKGLYKFWGSQISEQFNKLELDFIVNLLPNSYSKMLDIKNINTKIININFLTEKNGKTVKISHGVKKIKGEWIKNICNNNITDYDNFGGKIIKSGNIIDINIHLII